MDNDYAELYKIILVGDSSVGKTNLLTRFVSDKFDPSSKPTVGVDFFSRILKVTGIKVRTQIWDTAGQERFKAFASTYYNGTDGAVLVYDVTNRQSFENVTLWLKELHAHISAQLLGCILVGNKTDLGPARQVNTEEGQSLAEKQGFLFVEISAKESAPLLIEEAFSRLMVCLRKQRAESSPGARTHRRGRVLSLALSSTALQGESSRQGRTCCGGSWLYLPLRLTRRGGGGSLGSMEQDSPN